MGTPSPEPRRGPAAAAMGEEPAPDSGRARGDGLLAHDAGAGGLPRGDGHAFFEPAEGTAWRCGECGRADLGQVGQRRGRRRQLDAPLRPRDRDAGIQFRIGAAAVDLRRGRASRAAAVGAATPWVEGAATAPAIASADTLPGRPATCRDWPPAGARAASRPPCPRPPPSRAIAERRSSLGGRSRDRWSGRGSASHRPKCPRRSTRAASPEPAAQTDLPRRASGRRRPARRPPSAARSESRRCLPRGDGGSGVGRRLQVRSGGDGAGAYVRGRASRRRPARPPPPCRKQSTGSAPTGARRGGGCTAPTTQGCPRRATTGLEPTANSTAPATATVFPVGELVVVRVTAKGPVASIRLGGTLPVAAGEGGTPATAAAGRINTAATPLSSTRRRAVGHPRAARRASRAGPVASRPASPASEAPARTSDARDAACRPVSRDRRGRRLRTAESSARGDGAGSGIGSPGSRSCFNSWRLISRRGHRPGAARSTRPGGPPPDWAAAASAATAPPGVSSPPARPAQALGLDRLRLGRLGGLGRHRLLERVAALGPLDVFPMILGHDPTRVRLKNAGRLRPPAGRASSAMYR